MVSLLRVLAFVAVLCPIVAPAQGPTDSLPPRPASPVRDRLAAGVLDGARWPNIADVAAEVARAYDRVNWGPLWTADGRPTPAADRVVRLLGAVDSLGLAPADYDAVALDSLVRTTAPFDSATLVRFEATLSVSTARLLSTLRWGRARQPKAYPTLRRRRDDFELNAGIWAAARSADPVTVFDQAGPQWTPYRQLLAAYPAARRDAVDPVLDAKPARPGTAFASAARLRGLLRDLGFPGDTLRRVPPVDTALDATLARALRQFQKSAKLPQSGAWDGATRDSLTKTLRRRVRDATLALERWRWLPRTADPRAIIVNVPEFRLRVYDSVLAGAPATFGMKVVVGRGEEDRYTPLFVDQVEYLIFSPYWEVPKKIAVDEVVPKARKDSTYLTRNRYVLVRGASESAPVVAADSANLARIGTSVRVRQLPGDYNSLGRVKFMLPNDMNIYLHDTNEKGFFRREDRALSHGCVRVSEPTKLATWILAGDTAWTADRMKAAMKQEKPELVRLASHIPVLIVYHTAAVDDAGRLRAFKDVYAYDDELERLLARGYPYTR